MPTAYPNFMCWIFWSTFSFHKKMERTCSQSSLTVKHSKQNFLIQTHTHPHTDTHTKILIVPLLHSKKKYRKTKAKPWTKQNCRFTWKSPACFHWSSRQRSVMPWRLPSAGAAKKKIPKCTGKHETRPIHRKFENEAYYFIRNNNVLK